MTILDQDVTGFNETVERAIASLVRVRRAEGLVQVALPLIYADGSFVTIGIEPAPGRRVRVSDCGFAYREVEDLVGARSFRRLAARFADERDVTVGERALYVLCGEDLVERAIWDVAEASWRVVDTAASRALEDDEAGLSETLTTRLRAIFGEASVRAGADVAGASTTRWQLSALVEAPAGTLAFQAVTEHANSVNKASTAFRDLATLADPPKLVAVVRSKEALGSRLALLAPARVMEADREDDAYRGLAA